MIRELPFPLRVALAVLLWASAPAVLAQEEAAEEEGYRYQDETDIQAALEETLSQPEFAKLRAKPEEDRENSGVPEWAERLYRWLVDLFGGEEEARDEAPSFAFGLQAAELATLAFVTAIVGAILFFVVRSIVAASRRRTGTEEEGSPSRVFHAGAAPGEIAPDEYLRRALELGEGRRYKEALRELLLGAMSAIERRGLIRFRRGLTNRDYLDSVRGPARQSFAQIASAFEHVYFGRRSATPAAFRDCCREYQKSFREVTA